MVFIWRLSVCVLVVVLSTIGIVVGEDDDGVVVVIFLFYSDSS